ncbi:hypothetical protein M2281_000728 [Mesorhizobium soli]|uniref:DUF1254 domain-containing protein n=1 Tax=Pseudaminobacter soli (ex Li et al. 2025) TaxID=1295366 RepID=UPI0024744B22|nr:DUF1254 domain-containing protein [Mesorhizobium soli]MDH6230156.1 hypothetical protein [Mesorhizobium soli]
MLQARKASFAIGLLVSSLASAAYAQETQKPSYTFDKGYPTPETSAKAYQDADLQRAIVAYRFWYPTVSVEGIFNGNREAGLKDNEAMGAMAAGPKQLGFTLNSDTSYGAATLDLSKGPMVIDLPEGPYIGLIDDHNQSWVLDMGLPGPDGGKGGKYLLLGPGYEGKIPDGYHVGLSPTNKVLMAVRALPVGGDQQAALNALKAIKVHPLSATGDPKQMEVIDTTGRELDNTSLRWEDNMKFWQVLDRVIQEEPIVEQFKPMYGLLATLGIEKGKPFAPDARMQAILTQAANDGRDQMLVSAFASNRPDRLAWPDRQWEWVGLVPGAAQFETPSGVDLEARDRWFAQAIVTSPAMFRRTPGAGSLYWLGVRDATGAYLDGGKTYKLSIPQPVPGKLFWSVTAYDAQTRSEVQTDQDKAALRSLFELKDVNMDDPVELYFGPKAPAGQEGRWIKTVPGRGWFAYMRIYGPEAPAFDGSWKPSDFEEVK